MTQREVQVHPLRSDSHYDHAYRFFLPFAKVPWRSSAGKAIAATTAAGTSWEMEQTNPTGPEEGANTPRFLGATGQQSTRRTARSEGGMQVHP